ncbi:MAG: ribosomal protein S18-alanine N-acetyltransferase [Chloroflexota bacterium]|nr:ribosomal protein S18-alanine N-acetyltransferase [Chloroflexota bacterium]
MQTTAIRYQVRPMDIADISQVMEIERQSFAAMWPETAFKRELQRNRLARYLVAVEQRLETEDEGARPEPPPEADLPSAEAEGIGPPPAHTEPPPSPRVTQPHLGRWLAELKRLFGSEEEPGPLASREPIVGIVGIWLSVGEAHIVTIAVPESHRRRGIGELLLIAAIQLAILNDREVVTLECRVSNETARALYEKYGFRRVDIRPRYYSDNQEDALIMTTESIHSPSYQALFQRLQQEHRERCGDYQLAFS